MGSFETGRWLGLALATLAATVALDAGRVPSAALFAGLLVATIAALIGRVPRAVPARSVTAAQAILGVVIGALIKASTMRALGAHALAVILVTGATLLVSILAGMLLSLRRDVDPITGALALTAGGASAIVSLASEFGGDERMIAVVQYLRVALVTASMPVVFAFVFHPAGQGGHLPAPHHPAWYFGIAFLLVSASAGVTLARLVHFPAGALLGPLAVAAGLTLTGWSHGAQVPAPLVDIAYAVIGWQAGARFTTDRLKQVGRALPASLALIVLVNVICAGLGVLLAWLTGVSERDGYLATVPGGIYAALAIAVSSGTNVTFVLAVHVLRVILMMVAMPVFTRALRGYAARRSAAARTSAKVR